MPFDSAEWPKIAIEIDLTKRYRQETDVPFYDTIGRVLIRARNHVVDGWITGTLKRYDGVCVLGAIQMAARFDDVYQFDKGRVVQLWNDNSARRQDRVVRLFDRVIDTQDRSRLALLRKYQAEVAIWLLRKQISADSRA